MIHLAEVVWTVKERSLQRMATADDGRSSPYQSALFASDDAGSSVPVGPSVIGLTVVAY